MFINGYIQGDGVQIIVDIDTEESCAWHVRSRYAEASGVTWYLNSSCWAEFGQHIVRGSDHRTCLFPGTFCRQVGFKRL